jgi:hypothetical protein
MNKHISIDKLNEHLFETIEMLKNNKDPQADENEKIDVETAKAIAGLGKVILDGYKIKAHVLQMLNPDENPVVKQQLVNQSGILESDIKMIGQ